MGSFDQGTYGNEFEGHPFPGIQIVGFLCKAQPFAFTMLPEKKVNMGVGDLGLVRADVSPLAPGMCNAALLPLGPIRVEACHSTRGAKLARELCSRRGEALVAGCFGGQSRGCPLLFTLPPRVTSGCKTLGPESGNPLPVASPTEPLLG